MKLRYNHETKQWDIVLSEQEYQNIQQELNKLNLIRMEQSRLPISPPMPDFVRDFERQMVRFPDGFDLHPPNYTMSNVSCGIGYNDGKY